MIWRIPNFETCMCTLRIFQDFEVLDAKQKARAKEGRSGTTDLTQSGKAWRIWR